MCFFLTTVHTEIADHYLTHFITVLLVTTLICSERRHLINYVNYVNNQDKLYDHFQTIVHNHMWAFYTPTVATKLEADNST